MSWTDMFHKPLLFRFNPTYAVTGAAAPSIMTFVSVYTGGHADSLSKMHHKCMTNVQKSSICEAGNLNRQ